MKNEDVLVGMQVVPHAKTVDGWESLEESWNWQHAKEENGQKYLEVLEYDPDGYWVLGVDKEWGGDFFNADDFEPLGDNAEVIMKRIAGLQKEIERLQGLLKEKS